MSVTYNNVDLEQEFGMVCLGRGTYGAPARDIEQVHVPGRNGDLLIDNGGFLNFDLTYPECTIQEDFPYQARRLRNFLLSDPGYHKLTDEYNPGFYRLAEFRGPFTAEAHSARNNGSSVFDMVFNVKPMRYLGGSAGDPKIIMAGSGTTKIPYITNRSSYTWLNIDNEGSDALTVSLARVIPYELISTVTVQGGSSGRIQTDCIKGDVFMITVGLGESSSVRIYADGNTLYYRSGGSVVVRNTFEKAECKTTFYNWAGSIAHAGGTFAITNDLNHNSIDSESYQTGSNSGIRYMSGTPMYFKNGTNNITLTATGTSSGFYVYAEPRFCIL